MMRKTNPRLLVCAVLICMNLVFIWGNSLLPGDASDMLSRFVGRLAAWLFPNLEPTTPSGNHILRKLAHFSEFACLGLLLTWLTGMLRNSPRLSVLIPLFFGCMAACIDETIQRFVPGRGPSLIDVGIDTSGVALGVLVLTVGHILYKKTHTLEETT